MVTGVTVEELVERYPKLYHTAAAGSWPGVERHGLRSTTALLDLFEVEDSDRERIESQHRPESETIHHPRYGSAVIRDQKPMSDGGLVRALQDGLKPRDWYRILNKKVFFWLTPERLETLISAREYREQRKSVLVIDTRKLLERHSEQVFLSPMNSGCTKPYPHPRGLTTFRQLSVYPFADRCRRGLEPIVELAVDSLVPNVGSLVLHVEEVGGQLTNKILYP
jgi:hypothetical protein